MAFQISLSNTSSEFNLDYYEGIRLNGPYEVCLKSFVTYNNIPNITESNNQFIVVNAKIPAQYVIRLPVGTYEVYEIIELLMKDPIIVDSGTSIKLNKNTFQIEIKSETYDIDFINGNSIGRTLGFSANVFRRNTLHRSDLPVQIFTVNTIKIKCNLIKCNVDNLTINDNTLHEFPLKGEGGEKIIERPISLCYYPINTDNIYQLHLKVVDQDNNLIDFRGEKITIVLGFQPTTV